MSVRRIVDKEFVSRPEIQPEIEDNDIEDTVPLARTSSYRRLRRAMREPLSEMLGSSILVIMGDGSVAQALLSNNRMGNEMTINLCFGVGLSMGYLVAISGGAAGHLNPAITLTSCIFRDFPWRKLPSYVLAQMIGCAIGAACILGLYGNATTAYDGGQRQVDGALATANIYATYPVDFLDFPSRLIQELFGTLVLVLFVNAIASQSSAPIASPAELALIRALVLGLSLFGIGTSLGWQTGYALNPARDFGPRFVSYVAGYGPKVFTTAGYYFWIPIAMPCLGAIIGQIVFDFIVYDGESNNLVTNPNIFVNSTRRIWWRLAQGFNGI
ncbi:aquaporin-like protein [Lipomyces orientalis]|uniref:Aquaporin-like protein n=1 Tax=Lipomyces orientalis TaxID=1233043 RepID=A0ACC3TDI1_9ASCO